MPTHSAPKAKHTPGPWVAVQSNVRLTGSARNPIFPDGRWVVLPERNVERLPIAEIDYADDHDAPTRAKAEFDARLIAAAPELLTLCEEWVKAWDENEFELDIAVRMRAAIAKATGGAL